MLRAPLTALGSTLLALALSCGSARGTGPEPELALATSAAAQAEFRTLREQWTATPLEARVNLQPQLTRFVQSHPTDPQGRIARIYLAWISVQRGELATAERWLELAAPGPAGTATDLLGVVRAALELSRGEAAQAYRKLLSLEGRLIDTDDRLLCLDQLVRAALASEHHREAAAHILELAAQAARRHRERMWRTLAPRLASIPLPVLEASLANLSESSISSPSVRPAERAAAVDWMRREILVLLSRTALEQKDVGLAQRLVAAPSSRSAGEREKSELLRLATRGSRTPLIAGRTLGLALETDSPDRRQRAMDFVAGLALTLDLAQSSDDAQRIKLVTREVEGDGMQEALARLSAQGAALLAAGFDAESARAAAAYAREHGIAILLLHEPAPGSFELPEAAYVVGANEERANEVLHGALAGRGLRVISVGGDAAACAALSPADAIGLSQAQRRGPGLALSFEGSAHCAESVLMSFESARFARVGLGLGALAALDRDIAADEVWAVGAGRLPEFAGARDATLARWFELKGRAPTWHEALGHDVAALAGAALPPSAPQPVRDAEGVRQAYRDVRARLTRADLPDLWTTQAHRFDAGRRLPRDFRAVRVLPVPSTPSAGAEEQ